MVMDGEARGAVTPEAMGIVFGRDVYDWGKRGFLAEPLARSAFFTLAPANGPTTHCIPGTARGVFSVKAFGRASLFRRLPDNP